MAVDAKQIKHWVFHESFRNFVLNQNNEAIKSSHCGYYVLDRQLYFSDSNPIEKF